MKKLISVFLALMLTAATFSASTTAADGYLTVTSNEDNARSYHLGDEIVYTIGVYAGEVTVLNGEVEVTYDADRLELIEQEAEDRDGNLCMEGYSFPKDIQRSSLVLNVEKPGIIRFNFSRAKGVGVYNDPDKLFARFRFRIKSGGTTDVNTRIKTMCDIHEKYIYHNYIPDAEVAPYLVAKTMRAVLRFGDINNDGAVDGLDVQILDRYTAGWKGYDSLIYDMETADLNGDGKVNGRDALILDRYVAGWESCAQYIDTIEN